MGFYEEGTDNIIGYDIDLAAAVAERLGVAVEFVPVVWETKEMELAAYTIDCVWNGMSITPARQEAMCMTEAYLNNCIVILTKKDSGIEKVEDLAGKYVAVQGGSFAEEVLTIADYGYQDVYASIGEVITEADYLYAIMNLKNGMVDAVLIDEVVAQYELAKLGDETLVCVGNLCDDLYGIGFRKADVALMNAVYGALIDMAKDGTAAQIAANWFSADIVTPVLLGAEAAE